MNNSLLFEIERLHDLIEEKEREHLALINNNSANPTLQRVRINIEELKEKLQGMEEQFLKESLQQK